MAEIIQHLIDEEKLTGSEIMTRLGMEDEEVDRLYARGGMIERGSKDKFNKGWIPNPDED